MVSQSSESTVPQQLQPVLGHIIASLAILLALVCPLGAQNGLRQVKMATELQREPDGNTVLARLAPGAKVTATGVSGSRTEVTLEGWVAAGNLRNESRDGFDLVVTRSGGAPLLSDPETGQLLGTASQGALFHRVATKEGWVRVVRTAWIATDRLGEVTDPAANPLAITGQSDTQPPVQAKAMQEVASGKSGGVLTEATLISGASLAAVKGGSTLARVDGPLPARVLSREGGWSRVQLDLWVRDEALGGPVASGITAADLRADPDKYIGQQVEWMLQVLAVQKADELRPEIPLGQAYVLARGPLPESGFVYLIIPPSQVDRFKALDPLSRVKVRATVRLGRTKLLLTPVLDFVERIN